MEQSSNLQGSLIAQMQAIESQEKCAQIYLLIRIFVFFSVHFHILFDYR